MLPHGFSQNFVTKYGDSRLAGGQAVLGEQLGNSAIRGVLMPEFDNDVLGRDQVLELLWAARRKLRDCLANTQWIKGGHSLKLGGSRRGSHRALNADDRARDCDWIADSLNPLRVRLANIGW
jgi:hypothetical protein